MSQIKQGVLFLSLALPVIIACNVAQAAPSNTPVQGNPIDTLPQIEAPKPAEVKVTVQKNDNNQALANLLNTEITVKNFSIQGVKTLDFKDVAHEFEPLRNKPVKVADIINAANKITELYKSKGYPLSFAYVPGQNLETGNVNIVVVEGYIKDIQVTGDKEKTEAHVRRILAPLLNQRPLQQKTFERVSNLLALQPGLTVTLNVPPPNNTEGGTVLEAKVSQKKFDFSAGVEFRDPGTKALLSATVNNLTPLGDQLSFATLQPQGSDKEQYYTLNYTVPILSNGLMGKISASSYQEKPDNGTLTSLGYNERYLNKTQRLTFAMSYPLLLDNKHNWTLSGGFYLNDERQRYDPILNNIYPSINIETQLRVFYLENSFTHIYAKGTQQFVFGIYQGINGLGARRENNLNDLNFTKEKLQVTESYQLPWGFGTTFSGVAQYTPQTLSTSEQLSFGGRLFGLGYQPGELAGDKGWGMSLEFNRLFNVGTKYLQTVQPYVLVDNSRVYWNQGYSSHNHLASVALGFRVSDKKHYNLDFAVAKPVGDKPSDTSSRSVRLNLAYSYNF